MEGWGGEPERGAAGVWEPPAPPAGSAEGGGVVVRCSTSAFSWRRPRSVPRPEETGWRVRGGGRGGPGVFGGAFSVPCSVLFQMPPKKGGDGVKSHPIIGRFGTSLKIGIVGLPNVG